MSNSKYSVLAESTAARDTLTALSALAGMAVKLVSPDPESGEPLLASGTAPFCHLISKNRNGAAACRRFLAGLQEQLECGMRSAEGGTNPALRASQGAKSRPARAIRNPQSAFCTQQCFAGLTELAAPVTMQGRQVATLICGELFPRKPTAQDFERCLRRLQAMGIGLDRARAREAYFQTPIAGPARIRAARQVLADLAQHLGEMAARCLLERRKGNPPCVACAKHLVAQSLAEMPSTRSAAREAHVTPQYFCRMFKTAVGMTFSEYVARCHVDRARELLHDPDLRVTEVALAAGFQSIPHFNHTFERYTGLSPNGYRASLWKA